MSVGWCEGKRLMDSIGEIRWMLGLHSVEVIHGWCWKEVVVGLCWHEE